MQTQSAHEVDAARSLIEQWLAGDRSRHTHADVCIAIRQLLRVDLLNREIEDIFCDAVDREIGTTAVLERLVQADAVDDAGARQAAKPR